MAELGTYTVTILLRAQEQVTGAINRATAAFKKLSSSVQMVNRQFVASFHSMTRAVGEIQSPIVFSEGVCRS